MGWVDGCFLERCIDPHCFGFLKYNHPCHAGADVVVGRPLARSERPDVATSRGAVPLPGGVNMTTCREEGC